MTSKSPDAYALGRSKHETERLVRQGERLALKFRRFLEDAGITTGMKVLDLGSGAGDTTMGIAQAVGPVGSVVGIELDPASIEIAQQRAAEAGLENIRFQLGDLRHELELDSDFDAIVGRLVLSYLPDPTATLAMLLPHLKPGGIVAFVEKDVRLRGAHFPPLPLHDEVLDWCIRGQIAAGTDMYLGLQLYEVLLDAGFLAPNMKAECEIVTPARPGPNPTAFLRTIAPHILRAGIATKEQMDFDKLDRQLKRERERSMAVSIHVPDVYAWALRP
jgi:ubiquinone/menaquinone biosynthesis C-methylase UbiE